MNLKAATAATEMVEPVVPLNRSNVYIKKEDAEKALLALYPILDAMAEVPVCFPAQKRGAPTRIDQIRWHFYRVAQVLNMGVHAWPQEPQRYEKRVISTEDIFGNITGEIEIEDPVERWRCGMPTKKGTPCKRKIRWGRLACMQHATPTQMQTTREYQDAIHLPFPRVGEADIEKVRAIREKYMNTLVKDLQSIRERVA